jgi:ribonuclease E
VPDNDTPTPDTSTPDAPAPADQGGVAAAAAKPARRRRAAQRPAGPPAATFAAPEPDAGTAAPAAAAAAVTDAATAPLFQQPETTKPEPKKRAPRRKASATKDADAQAAPAEPTPEPARTSEPAPSEAADAPTPDSDGDESTATPGSSEQGDESTPGTPRKRRRRGGRGRRKTTGDEAAEGASDATPDGQPDASGAPSTGGSDQQAEQPRTSGKAEQGEPTEQAETSEQSEPGEQGGAGTSSSSRRRRRRRRTSDGSGAEQRNDDPEETVVRVRETRKAESQITATKGSTRVEAKRQRRRDGRDSGRRRPTIMSESEFLARRESVERVMVVRQKGERDDAITQLAVLEDGMLVEHYVDQGTQRSIIGNIYLGKVQNVLPAMEAAFVDIGRGRNAVLYAGEVDWSQSEGKAKRIEEALTPGQSILVQVTKDPLGHKGARLTSSISLPGRFVVYVPGGSMSGISRKLSDTERSRLRTILKDVVPDEAEVIIRTAAEGAGEEELRRDVARLKAQWEDIERKAGSGSAPTTLYAEPDLTLKIVRDLFNEDFASLVVAGDDAWDTIEPYVGHVAPVLTERLQRWESAEDVFEHYRVDEQIAKALDRKVWLPSGGSLVIDRTEAMTVVDVNTGKFTGGGGNLEETVTKNNLEAAEEVARQLRLRDIGGIIVVDFIDMVLESNRDLVLRRLVECLARDRTRHQVAEVTSLGLVQMTRKRIGTGLLETFSKPCECCGGRGLTTTSEPVPVPQRDGDERRGRSGGKSRKSASTARSKASKPAADAPSTGAETSS